VHLQVNGWTASLGVGSYSQIGNTCVNDKGLCTVESCGLPAGDLSDMAIPAGLKVTLYDKPNFSGNSLVIQGPTNPDTMVRSFLVS
jgi:hypothetical protein